MAHMFGSFIGALLLIAFLSAIIEHAAFGKYEPKKRAGATVGSAYLIVSLLSAFSNNDPVIILVGALFAAAIIYAWYVRRYEAAWSDE